MIDPPALIKLTKEEIKFIAETGKKSFYFFCHDILGKMPGFEDIQEVPHRWMCNIAQKWNKRKKLILTPRDTYKTTILVVAYSLWRIVNNPHISILLTSDSMKNSIKSLSVIKTVIEQGEFFRACYGDLVGDTPWSDTQIKIKTEVARASRTPTVEASGADSSMVGSHYDLIIFDDPHNLKNISTPEQIKKVLEYYRGLMPLMDTKRGQLMIVATRWHFQDLENHILLEEPENFDVYIKAAYWEEGGKTVFFFPNRLTPEFLEARKKEIGTYFFSTQYMNNPMDDDSAIFKTTYFKNFVVNNGVVVYKENEGDFDSKKYTKEEMKFFILIDPAGRGTVTQQRRLDYTGVVVLGVSPENEWFVYEAFRKKGLKPSEIIEMVFCLHNRYLPVTIGIESTTWQGELKEGVIRESQKRGIWPPVKDLTHDNRSKPTRIMGLQPLYEAGIVYHVRGLYDLEDELLRWSINSTIHDDIIDALAYAKDIAYCDSRSDYVRKVVVKAPTKSPGFMIEAYENWQKGGERQLFRRFLEEYEPDEEGPN
jgi:predicted phage terminase large subunit-like protein